MEEPTVLDYLKSKLTFWRKSSLHLPPAEHPASSPKAAEAETLASINQELPPPDELVSWLKDETLPEASAEQPGTPGAVRPIAQQPVAASLPVIPEVIDENEIIKVPDGGTFPWLTVIALFFALCAQLTFEPGTGDRIWRPGVVMYAVAAILLVAGFFRKEWILTPLRKNEDTSPFALYFNRNLLIAGGLLAVITFLAFNGGVFNFLNLVLWFATMLLVIRGFWLKDPNEEAWHKKAWRKITQRRWNITFNRWSLLVVLVGVIVIFFRYFRINQVPSDMISDHAEKLLDVFDVVSGKYGVFFPRNTGREFIQFYFTAAIIAIFKTGFSYLSLKIGTITIGAITLPYLYLLGKELGNKRIGLWAAFFCGIAYWPNVISRIGLRFPLYPMFVAPVFYYLFRGIRRRKINDFILSGIFLGIGLNGYTPIRVLPFVVVAAILIYLLHKESAGVRKQTILALVILAVVAVVFVIPLARYTVSDPEIVFYRTMTRMGTEERAFPGNPVVIFLENLWNSLIMPFWSNGNVWVNSIPLRPALDVVSAALFFMGCVMLVVRYIRKRNWLDLFLLVSIPLLMMSSILSLAFPDENPSLNRSGGAYITIFIIMAMALDCILVSIKARLSKNAGILASGALAAVLVIGSLYQNYDLVFNQFAKNYTQSAWNTAEMGEIVKEYTQTYGNIDSAYVVAYAYWVDTRLVAINAGYPTLDLGIWPADFDKTKETSGSKLFLIDTQDTDSIQKLEALYPSGYLWLQQSKVDSTKNFYVFLVPPAQEKAQQ